MLSTPPAIMSSASPDLMARAAIPTASMLDPHKRLIVDPVTSFGNPASSSAMRATLRLSSPALIGGAINHIVERSPVDAPGVSLH